MSSLLLVDQLLLLHRFGGHVQGPGMIESFRNKLWAGYKTGERIEPELLGQFPLLEEALTALGVVVWPMVEFEADDALAAATVKAEGDPRVDRVIICTPDKDLAQCVRGTRVVQLDRRRNLVRDETAVIAKFGVLPPSIPDYLPWSVTPREDKRIVRTAPLLCIEILSPEDRMGEMQERVDDYLQMGVRAVWMIDPRRRRAFLAEADGKIAPAAEMLTLAGTEVQVPVADVFAELDRYEQQ